MKKLLDFVRIFLWSMWGDIPADTGEIIEESMRSSGEQEPEEKLPLMQFLVVCAIVLLGITLIGVFFEGAR